jgi:hypothetical protein
MSAETESGFCNECGWPVQSCVCGTEDDEDDYDVCEHGVGFDEDCADCAAEGLEPLPLEPLP